MYKLKIKALIAFMLILVFSFIVTTVFAISNDQITPSIPSFHNITEFIDSNKYTHQDDLSVVTSERELNSNYQKITTEIGDVYLDLDSLAFEFENNNGYIWSSTIDYENSTLSPNWKRRVRSAVHIEAFNTNNSSYAIIEEFILSDGTFKITNVIENGFESKITFGVSQITILLRVKFTNQGITVEIPNEEIVERDTFKLSSIKVYPFFGAVLEDTIPGYVFVPDGIGALVRYNKANSSTIGDYKKEIYDRNIGYNIETNLNNFKTGGTRIYAPVFGFVHGINQNAVFANITSGAEYGMINLLYPGKMTNYTTIFSEFVYRKTYKQPIDKAGNTISLLQKYRNDFDIVINYSLLENEEANYIGMAKVYREYLFDLEKLKSSNNTIPLKLDTIGIEKTKGVLFDKTIVMTTISQFQTMINDLKGKGIDNIVATYSGFSSDGVTWSSPKYEQLSSKLGSKSELINLKNSVNDLYFVVDYLKASNKSSGFNRYTDLAKKITDQFYTYQSSTDTKHLLEHQKTEKLFFDSINHLDNYQINSLAIESIGNILYADYKNEVYLDDAINLYQQMLASTDMKIGLYDANSYLWNSLDEYFDFPMYSSQYLQFNDTVPFLSIVLRGQINLYGANANFYPYARDELLRLIDFGVYPSFVVTNESSKKLQKTDLEYIYTSKYSDLSNAINTYYQFVNGALQYVIDEKIIDRVIIDKGVVEIKYANGVSIVVNYTSDTVNYMNNSISPKNYIVLKDDNLLSTYLEGGN